MRDRLLTLAVFVCGACVVSPLDPTGKQCDPTDLCPTGFLCEIPPQASGGACRPGDGGVLYVACLDAGIGSVCSRGRGECERTGVLDCAAGTVTCTATPGAPSAERCNGLDDDCDGLVDALADGGPLRDGRPCELDAGVCAGATHACVDGGFESVCTGASYGTAFQLLESACDHVDNDCDGRIDVSRSVALLAQASESLAWFATDAGLVAIGVAETGPLVNPSQLWLVRYGWDLEQVGSPVALVSDTPQGASSFSVRRVGDDFLVAWVVGSPACSLQCPPPLAVRLSRHDALGAPRWQVRTSDGGMSPSVQVGVGQLVAAPALAVADDGGVVVVVWSAHDAGVFASAVAGADGSPRWLGARLDDPCARATGGPPGFAPHRVDAVGVGADEVLVGWESRIDAGAMGAPGTALGWVRLDLDGGLRDSTCAANEPQPNALRLTEGPVAVWQAVPGPPSVRAPIRATFDPFGAPAFEVWPDEAALVESLDVVRSGSDYVAAWTRSTEVGLARVSSSGARESIAVAVRARGAISLAPGPGTTLALSYFDVGTQHAGGVLVCRP